MSTLTQPALAIVGGFLGAGKTTLLLAAAKALHLRGRRAAIILNDQSDDLVDTTLVETQKHLNREVTGGCFCCRFSDLAKKANELAALDPDVIFAEPVGSCTDLAATVIRPLRMHHGRDFRIAPLTVLVDPARYRDLDGNRLPSGMAYLFRKQLEEADIVVFTKADLYPDPPATGMFSPRKLSAHTGEGVDVWLDEVLDGELTPGAWTLDIDYKTYARAEASLVWLNMKCNLRFRVSVSPSAILGPLLETIDSYCTRSGVTIAHAKAILASENGLLKAAIVANEQEPQTEGDLIGAESDRFDFLLNLRADGTVSAVRGAVLDAMLSVPATCSNQQLRCFRPSEPKPEYRYA